MIDFEKSLIPTISFRFKNLRVNGGRKLKPEVISYGQKSAILKLEKEGVPASGNFVSDRLLGDYSDYFNETKEYLIFGNQKEIYNQLSGLFFLIFLHLISNKDVNYANMFKTQGEPDKKNHVK